jgi:RNA polymerase sigma factor (sigma-70 family)
MSSLPLPSGRPVRRLASLDDEALVDRVRAGDESAFGELLARYETRMVRYARRVLGGSHEVAEDVVQEALWRAHRALRRDDRPIALRPWLYRLVRNCCLDELARGRNDALDLHALHEEPAALDADPSIVAERRRRTRDLLGDLAALPADQRHAVLRREVDGLSHAALARELGLTVAATRSLVHRGRRNLVKAADARDAGCEEVREDLDRAFDEGRRASARAYRHLAACRGCRSYRSELRRIGATSRLLLPAPALFVVGGALVTAVKSTGGGAGGGGAGLAAGGAGGGGLAGAGGLGVKAGGLAAAAALVAGGATQVFGPGDPSPVSADRVSAALTRGAPIPAGTAVATRRFTVPAAGTSARLTVSCPAGTVAAELLPATPARLSHGMTTVPGTSRTAAVTVAGNDVGDTATIRVLCKRPDPMGSLLAQPSPYRARAATTICWDRAYLHRSPGGSVSASTFRGQPLKVLEAAGGWRRVRADSGETGWLRAQSLCASSRR